MGAGYRQVENIFHQTAAKKYLAAMTYLSVQHPLLLFIMFFSINLYNLMSFKGQGNKE